ncbi:UbiH/UbiF/VisC/COQ6 family ubiquinone biosynthesis hydroxylase [Arenibaculum pallidiluteum]|uniref:UbiH/UbiF/VisC/COQ6 family ubiquinone biosynthesis hydroxylase n=1 Tax=Arenibaculum pallidiluteum TaxID=2812559 RepID=UPI001A96F4B1|nr:UbiH/UbiF/VisC/COQ6 family ubiquinone biosynthesis hydroxylase [Arenibaculum pallidiluteum]
MTDAPALFPGSEIAADVLVVGGGLSGLTLACALAGAGVPVVCADRDLPAVPGTDAFDGRTTALALGSRRVLEGAGVWPYMAEAAEGGSIWDIRVADKNSPLFLHYDHQDVGLGAMGHVVDNATIRHALAERARALSAEAGGRLLHLAPVAVTALARDAGGATAELSDGRRVRARLVVGADGKDSFCRKHAGIGVTRLRYGQTALICNIGHEKPHHGIALEHFLPSGPFAVLPLCPVEGVPHRSSIVWSLRDDMLALYRDLPDAAFARELERRAGPWLGTIRPVTRRWSWPLGVMHAERYVDDRLALVGEAAHAMHPIAGQGLNMGLRDVAALAEAVVDARRLGLDPGGADVLARYQRWRRFDNVSLIAVTDALTRLFSNDIAPLRLARDLGMAAVHRLPPLKRLFMRHAMGMVGQLPRLIRGEPL